MAFSMPLSSGIGNARHTPRELKASSNMPDKASLMQQSAPPADLNLEREIATLFVHALNLEIAPGDIEPDAPLYGEGLGLDSIDILEVALIVSKKYGVQLRADSQENHKIFRSLRHLAEYIAKQRTK
ncbi:MAG TPA: phosphopantetheine-binding protein [Steroidobacteraceae bacterium]|nr:phosphopantetheine-binding protein [Steroidobacteraceae bacterium]